MERNKDYIKSRYYLRKLAKMCQWPEIYKKPTSYPCIAVWAYDDYTYLNITYVYEKDFNL